MAVTFNECFSLIAAAVCISDLISRFSASLKNDHKLRLLQLVFINELL